MGRHAGKRQVGRYQIHWCRHARRCLCGLPKDQASGLGLVGFWRHRCCLVPVVGAKFGEIFPCCLKKSALNRVVENTDDFKPLWAWQDRIRGWYEGKIKPTVLSLRHELAEKGLTDQELDDSIQTLHPTKETILAVTKKLRILACDLD